MKAIFIYNPESGSGRIRRNISYIKKKLESKYSLVDIYESKSKEDLIKKFKILMNIAIANNMVFKSINVKPILSDSQNMDNAIVLKKAIWGR